MKYNLRVVDGGVNYLMRSGKDIVHAKTSINSALWLLDNRGVERASIEGFPEYCVCAGGFYFDGSWEPEEVEKPKKRRKKDVDA